MRLWVTRTRPQAEATATRLRRLGHEAVVQPVLEVKPLANVQIDLAGFAAIAFSSQNGVKSFAWRSTRRELPVFVTGEGTARAALDAGFRQVETAGGGLQDLAKLIIQRRPPGRIAWFGPQEPAGDLAAMLKDARIEARLFPIYATAAAEGSPPNPVDGILVHSPKAAGVIAERLSPEAARGLTLFAISEAAAAPLADFKFTRVEIAKTPDEEALLARVKNFVPRVSS
jgi:uroporphyrinogen-III synthase